MVDDVAYTICIRAWNQSHQLAAVFVDELVFFCLSLLLILFWRNCYIVNWLDYAVVNNIVLEVALTLITSCPHVELLGLTLGKI